MKADQCIEKPGAEAWIAAPIWWHMRGEHVDSVIGESEASREAVIQGLIGLGSTPAEAVLSAVNNARERAMIGGPDALGWEHEHDLYESIRVTPVANAKSQCNDYVREVLEGAPGPQRKPGRFPDGPRWADPPEIWIASARDLEAVADGPVAALARLAAIASERGMCGPGRAYRDEQTLKRTARVTCRLRRIPRVPPGSTGFSPRVVGETEHQAVGDGPAEPEHWFCRPDPASGGGQGCRSLILGRGGDAPTAVRDALRQAQALGVIGHGEEWPGPSAFLDDVLVYKQTAARRRASDQDINQLRAQSEREARVLRFRETGALRAQLEDAEGLARRGLILAVAGWGTVAALALALTLWG